MKEQIILRGNTNGYEEYRIPGILVLSDALLLTCEARIGGMGDWGDIDILVLRFEKDGSYHEVLKIGESDQIPDGRMRTYNNPVLIPDGERVHLIYHKNYEKAFIVTSEDSGKNWSEAREITETFREFPYQWNVCATGPGHGIQLKSGRLIAPIWIANGKVLEDGMRREHWPSTAGCIYSDDHGVTWKCGFLVENVIDANETSVAQAEDGMLLFNFRNREAKYRRVLGISEDGGETLKQQWIADALVDPMCMGGMSADKDKIFFVNCNTENARTDLTVKCTKDLGKTWEVVWEIDQISGYADIAVIDEKMIVFYEHTVGNKITELVLQVKTLK